MESQVRDRGHRDKLKNMMVHTSQNLQPSSVRLFLSLAELHGFCTWTSDVSQSYLQSAEPLMRGIFISRPVPGFELEPHQCLKLLKPLYGLCESGDMWHRTLDAHHKKDMGMRPLRSDLALYVLMREGPLSGLSGKYVDYMIRAGNEQIQKIAQSTSQRFQKAEDSYLPCGFTGFLLYKDKGGCVQLNQADYLDNLRPMPEDSSYSQFASMRMKLAWLTHSRPDCMYEMSQRTQFTRAIFDEKRRDVVRRINQTVIYAEGNTASLRFPKLDLKTLHVLGISDASFASNHDATSQLGFLCFLADGTGQSIPVYFKSYKAGRVTRSVLEAELIAFSDLFDHAFNLSDEIRAIHPDAVIPVKLLTDNKSLFDVISKGSKTSEKRLMQDIACAREVFVKHGISNTGFVRSGDNIAYGLTKRMKQEALRGMMEAGSFVPLVEQWIVRTAPNGES